MTRTDRTATALRSIAALVALTVIVPAGLVAASRARFGSANPLVGVDPPWRWSLDAVGDALREPLRDDAVVNLLIRGCLAVVWIAVTAVVVTTIVEFVHLARHRGIPAPRVRGLGWAQRSAHFIAAGLIAALPIVSSPAVATGAGNVSVSAVTAAVASSPATPAGWTMTATTEDAGGGGRFSIVAGTSAEEHRNAPPSAEDTPGSVEEAPGSHVVRRGDSIWSIAEGLAPDGDDARTMDIADALLDANLGRTMNDGSTFTNPALIRVGWTILLPGDTVDATALPMQTADTRADDRHGVEVSDEFVVPHVVEPGETLSSIAAEHLGDPDRWPEIFETNVGRTMPDGRTLVDADLIVPGWTIDVPTDDTAAPADPGASNSAIEEHPGAADLPDHVRVDTATVDDDGDGDGDLGGADLGGAVANDTVEAVDNQADDTVSAVDDMGPAVDDTVSAVDDMGPAVDDTVSAVDDMGPAVDDTVSAVDDTELDLDGGPDEAIERPTSTADDERLPGPTSPMPGTSAPTTTTPPPVVVGEATTPPSAASESPTAPTPLRLEHAAFLAAGVLALVGARRRRRLRAALPRARVPAPRADVATIERRLRSLAPGEVAMRLDVALRAAAHGLADQDVGVGMVRLGPDGEVTLRLTRPARLTEPWRGLGTDWELPASVPIELLTEEARRSGAPCAALAEIGIDRDGRSVLVDVEAAGLTAVDAQSDQSDEVIRALAMSLASSLHAEVAHLIAVGLDETVLLGHPNAHHRASATDAIDLALALAGSTVDNERTTFDLRTRGTGGEMWEPAVVVCSAAATADVTDTGLPAPGHGFGLIAATTPGGLPSAPVRLTAHADRWELDAFGDRFDIDPIGIEDEDVTDITTLLDDADTPIPTDPMSAPTGDEQHATPFAPRPHELVVGLLGGVEIRSRHGELGRFERSKTVELIAWLATHRARSTRTAARTALWEIDVRDATFANVVSEARRALGRLVDPPDGEEWVARTLTESLPLHDHVVTDADLVRDRLDHARLAAPSQAIEVLRPAVELVRDMPFAGTSYLWPDADGITSELVLLATTVTAELAAHALSVGDVDTVFWATGHGLRVLPGHEELIALRMRAHARAGDLAGVRAEWESYERVIIADAWSDGEPAPKLLELRRELLSP